MRRQEFPHAIPGARGQSVKDLRIHRLSDQVAVQKQFGQEDTGVAIIDREVASRGSTNPLEFPIATTFFTQLRSYRPEANRTIRVGPAIFGFFLQFALGFFIGYE